MDLGDDGVVRSGCLGIQGTIGLYLSFSELMDALGISWDDTTGAKEGKHGYMSGLTYYTYTLLCCISMVMFLHVGRGKGGCSRDLVPCGKGAAL
ncbi:uncharacterized protein B0T23DRAFT_370729 [Neurospora hispaniola]|uniref:Uncharacterized protein n=1 Tax=Neurospora hispaniola TaxID=588809 RepID=A0AAJ0IGB2_9PEZI|nr:hypothetical protein B0T23DRAFT_370729 [Neurospora hispaniola]